MPRGRTNRSDRTRATFLRVLAEQCNVSEAARQAGISRRASYDWRADDAGFAADWEEAEQTAVDSLEKTAWERATKDKSDRMLEILLKGHRPERYTDRMKVEVTDSARELEEARRRAKRER
jgi:hypothetical protein